MTGKQKLLLKISFPLLLILLIVVSVVLNYSNPNARPQSAHAASIPLSQNKPVTVSSAGGTNAAGTCCAAKNAVDGTTTTRWASAANIDPSWIYVDLGTASQIDDIKLIWDLSCATAYQLQTSNDHATWTPIYTTTTGKGGTEDIQVNGTGRYVRMYGTHRCRTGTAYGYSLQEFQVFGSTDTQPPTTPGNVHSTAVDSTSVTLAWTASTDNVGVVAYDIYNDGNLVTTAPGNVTSFKVTGLTPNTTYRLSLDARDAAGNVSIGSNQAIVTTTASSDTTPPMAPTNLKVTGTTSSTASLSWTASTDNVGVTSYDVLNAGVALNGNPITGTTYTVTGLASNTTYLLVVVAHDAAGNTSQPSNQVSATTAAGSGGVPSSITTLSTGWSVPWGMSWLPDGSMLVTERDTFNLYHESATGGTRTLIGKIPNVVTTGGEGGLLGIAVDPNWSTNHFIYIDHTASEGNRIVRMVYNGKTISSYTILVKGIAKNKYHNGGRLAFGPDGYLYATTGDAENGANAQNKSSLNGKILRMKTDGTPAPGNPFGTLIYSYGHRNPQGLAWDSSGNLWEAEFGNSAWDELNLIKPGLNYGWPTCEGNCTVSGMTNPKAKWPVNQASPSAIAIVNNVVYMAALRGQRLWRIPLNGTSAGTPQAYYVNQYGRLRTVMAVPGKNQLWLSTTNCDLNGNQPPGSDKVFLVTIK
ncbi:MAG TPA: PQQ-dependent sugar dehydrogenase [Ktedonobacteraceae bacterium]